MGSSIPVWTCGAWSGAVAVPGACENTSARSTGALAGASSFVADGPVGTVVAGVGLRAGGFVVVTGTEPSCHQTVHNFVTQIDGGDQLVHDRRMRSEKSCGLLVFQDVPRRSFLLLVRGDGFDLPKGRMKKGEDELACAFRELEEETGLARDVVSLVDGFRFENTYCPNKRTQKTVVLYAGLVAGPVAIVTPDHDDYAWVPWRPPHDYREHPTIHRALLAWYDHVAGRAHRRAS